MVVALALVIPGSVAQSPCLAPTVDILEKFKNNSNHLAIATWLLEAIRGPDTVFPPLSTEDVDNDDDGSDDVAAAATSNGTDYPVVAFSIK